MTTNVVHHLSVIHGQVVVPKDQMIYRQVKHVHQRVLSAIKTANAAIHSYAILGQEDVRSQGKLQKSHQVNTEKVQVVKAQDREAVDHKE